MNQTHNSLVQIVHSCSNAVCHLTFDERRDHRWIHTSTNRFKSFINIVCDHWRQKEDGDKMIDESKLVRTCSFFASYARRTSTASPSETYHNTEIGMTKILFYYVDPIGTTYSVSSVIQSEAIRASL